MIATTVNNYVWSLLCQSPEINDAYESYRNTYGENFIPFFPVDDDNAGDISWGTDCYILYDSIATPPNRAVYGERREQLLYTVIGPVPQVGKFKDAIIDLFDAWGSNSINIDGYRITNISAWQSSGTQGRDKIRQTYAVPIVVEVNYIKC